MATYKLQYTIGSATAASDLYDAIAGVRNDAASSAINPTNLAFGAFAVDASGRIFVSGTVGVASVSAITAYQGTSPWIVSGNVSANQVGVWGVTASAITATQVIPGTAATHLGKAEDAVHNSGDTGVLALAVANAAGTPLAAEGDYTPIAVNAAGYLLIDNTIPLLTQSVYPEDSGHVTTNVGDFILGVRNDTDAGRTNANSDYSPISTDYIGRVKVAGNLVSATYVVGGASGSNGLVGLGVASAVEPVYGASALWPVSMDLAGYQRVIGPPTTAGTPAAFVVTSATALLATSNPARRSILITNNGAGVLYIGHTTGVTTASATMGLYVQASGGAYTDSGFGIYTGNLYGIYSAASTTHNVVVSERT